MSAPIGFPAVLRNLPGRLLDDWGTVDVYGGEDASGIINEAIAGSADLGDPLWIGPGDYLNSSTIKLVSGANIILSTRATLIRNTTSLGSTGHITQADLSTPIQDVKWSGGRIYNPDPATLTGNAFGVNCEDSDFGGFFIDEWSSLGRAMVMFGARNKIHDFRAVSVNDGGGIRPDRCVEVIVSNAYVACGDDCYMWNLPAQGTFAGGYSARNQYINCIGYSWNARVLVTSMQRTTVEADVDGTIEDCIAIGVRGKGKMGFACYNTLGTGPIRRIRLIGCQFDCSDFTSSHAGIDIYGDASHGGVYDIEIENTDVISPGSRAVLVRGISRNVRFTGGFLGAPRTTQNTVDVDEAAEAHFTGTVFEGRGDADVVKIGDDAAATARAFFRSCTFREIANTYDGVVFTSAQAGEVTGCRFVETSGATTARALTIPAAAANVRVSRNDYSGLTLAAKMSWAPADNGGCVVDATDTRTISAHTTTYAYLSGTTYVLTGATTRTLTLPAAKAGLEFTLVQEGTGAAVLRASGSDTIRIPGSVSSAGGTITSGAQGNFVRVRAVSGKWVAVATGGTWTAA
jgi:hypothetical protein